MRHTSTKIILAIVLAFMGVSIFLFTHFRNQPQPNSPHVVNTVVAQDLHLAKKNTEQPWEMITIKPGDTLQGVFLAEKIPLSDLWPLLRLRDLHLKALHPHQHIYYMRDAQHHLLAMRLPLSVGKEQLITKNQSSYVVKTLSLPITTQVLYRSGTITSSLANATKAAGLPNQVYAQLAKAFQGKVNFSRDLHKGDTFSLLYKQYAVNNTPLNRQEMLAAKLVTQKQPYYAIQFHYPKNHTGYFTLAGHSIEPRFLTYPLHYRRISSHFSYHRLDPILHTVRPHLGIDFAAKTGTPIRSIGDGKITFVGHDHGYGNAVKIRYDKHYSALYAHMHHFSPLAKLSHHIHKGDIIGYVGSTGWSTGPHLHFSFYENGKPKDWLALHPLPSYPIPPPYRDQFKKIAQTLLSRLDLQDTKFAANTTHLIQHTP